MHGKPRGCALADREARAGTDLFGHWTGPGRNCRASFPGKTHGGGVFARNAPPSRAFQGAYRPRSSRICTDPPRFGGDVGWSAQKKVKKGKNTEYFPIQSPSRVLVKRRTLLGGQLHMVYKIYTLKESVRVPPNLFGLKLDKAALEILREQYERTRSEERRVGKE